MTDVEAGHRAGCRTVLLEGQEDPAKSPFAAPEHTVASIMAAANAILSQPETRR
jgi:predicted HAD superfamily phosphohydrolase YqeG